MFEDQIAEQMRERPDLIHLMAIAVIPGGPGEPMGPVVFTPPGTTKQSTVETLEMLLNTMKENP